MKITSEELFYKYFEDQQKLSSDSYCCCFTNDKHFLNLMRMYYKKIVDESDFFDEIIYDETILLKLFYKNRIKDNDIFEYIVKYKYVSADYDNYIRNEKLKKLNNFD